jgi:hypothetical protein
MKVLTIRQPWATLIMLGVKKYEFRSWNTKFRGEFLIHAGKGIDKEALNRLSKYLPDEKLPQGKIIGKATLTDCIAMNEEFAKELANENNDIYTTHSFSRNYAFKLENIEKFEKPIDAKGQLGFWNYTY